ncbi:MAG: diguanylate cyclase [Spirochaetia bacterium]|jgi:diguanylate cyclase (GGDEF)-like protein|nr:diguanylate cyclase [Spirochaetia bacterium]
MKMKKGYLQKENGVVFNKKNRLMIMITLLLAAGFLATSFASYFTSRSSLQREITLNTLPLTSDNIYSEIQRDLLRPIFICSLMANDTFMRDWVINGEKDAAEIAKYLNEIKQKYNSFTSFFVSDITDNYYFADGILKKVKPDEVRDIWYYRVREMEDEFEINIDPDLSNNDAMTIFINFKVFDYSGNFIGATGVGLTVNAVASLINEYQEKYDRNIFFIDRTGNVTLRGANSPDKSENIHDMPGLSKFADDILGGGNNTYIHKKMGVRNYLHTRYISEFDWFLLVEENEGKAAGLILKTLLINLLLCLLVTAVVIFILWRAISSYQARIEKLASTDKLTGLLNRQSFDIIINQAVSENRRNKTLLSFIVIDLDHFKKINDSFGHLMGDEVLRKTSEILKNQLRKSDAICRWGGEEFFILLKGCSIDDAFFTAEKLRTTVQEKVFIVKGEPLSITLSCGISEFTYSDTAATALERADRALYLAKENGRNRTEKLN